MGVHVRSTGLVLVAMLATSSSALAQLSWAIFTTDVNGDEVNGNIYTNARNVYLNGGPPPGAPQTAAGLPNGTYVFQVTDPSGKTVLSTDAAVCRQFTVSNGIITAVVPAGGCEHATSLSIDHNATTVQLFPFNNTPNNGGEYKAWATPVANYLAGCAGLGVPNGLSVVDCGITGGNFHGFIPSHSKTDNFKVKNNVGNREIDTHFFDSTGNETVGICETWIDTLGVSNPRCSEVDLSIGNLGWAHVEAVEDGVHQFVISNQPGCTVGLITLNLPNGPTQYFQGPQTIDVHVSPSFKSGTITIWVQCQ